MCTRERERVVAQLAQRASARHRVAHRHGIRAAEGQIARHGDCACAQSACGAAAAYLQGARIYHCGRVAVGAGQYQSACAHLGQVSPCDGPCPRHAAASSGVERAAAHQGQATVGAGGCGEHGVEIQGGVVYHQLVGGAAGGRCAQVGIAADGQTACVHIGGTGIGVGTTQGQGTCAFLLDDARARNDVGNAHRVGTLEHQGGVVDDVATAQVTRGARIAHLQGTRANGGGASVGTAARQHQGALACFAEAARTVEQASHRLGVACGYVHSQCAAHGQSCTRCTFKAAQSGVAAHHQRTVLKVQVAQRHRVLVSDAVYQDSTRRRTRAAPCHTVVKTDVCATHTARHQHGTDVV